MLGPFSVGLSAPADDRRGWPSTPGGLAVRPKAIARAAGVRPAGAVEDLALYGSGLCEGGRDHGRAAPEVHKPFET